MAGMCYGLNVAETDTAATVEPSPKSARRRMEARQFNFVPENSGKMKRRKTEDVGPAVSETEAIEIPVEAAETTTCGAVAKYPKFGMTSVCGRRRDMEDAVSIRPNFCRLNPGGDLLHFFGVFDGHGCSHVATRCKERMHEIVRDEVVGDGNDSRFLPWEELMCRSFLKMDKDVSERSVHAAGNCRCELRTPQFGSVGSTAVVAVISPEKIVVSNCGDSRAVLCRNGVAIPLSADHKPDRADELKRISEAGGRVIFWDGPRVLGVLSMSRAIGDNYLKPYVIAKPEVTIRDRGVEDECLILASDGLWDVVSNETACGVVRMCLHSRKPGDTGCSDASVLLTKLALARRTTDNVSVVVVDLRRR